MFSDFTSSLFCLYISRFKTPQTAAPRSPKHPENTGLPASDENFPQSSSVPYAWFALLILAAAAKVQLKEKQR
jgi:hypothetical protein